MLHDCPSKCRCGHCYMSLSLFELAVVLDGLQSLLAKGGVLDRWGRTATYVDVRRRTSSYVDVRPRASTDVDVRRRTSTYVDARASTYDDVH